MTYVNFYINPASIKKERGEISSIYELLSFLFPEVQITSDREQRLIELDPAFLPEMQVCADGIHREIRDKRHGYGLAVDGYMKIVYTGLLRAIVPTPSQRRKILSCDILDYIEKNFTKRITLTDLAVRFYYNPVYLGKLFKNTYGLSFKQYILKKRLSLAASMLLDSDITVEGILETVGFADKKFFYSCFAEKFGCTPLKIQKRQRGVKPVIYE